MTHPPPLPQIAVLTGDMVASSALGAQQLERAMDALQSAAKDMAPWCGGTLDFTRHRGDGWQVVIRAPRFALRAALAFRARLKALGAPFDSYMALAVGDSAQTPGGDLNARSETVFVDSGRALERLKSGPETPIRLVAPYARVAAPCALADYISRGWTPAQAQAVALMIPPQSQMSYTEAAQILGKSRQSVTKSLDAAGFGEIDLALSMLEQDLADV